MADQAAATDEESPGSLRDFDLKADAKKLFTTVAKAYGFDCVFDPDYEAKQEISFRMQRVDYRAALHGLEAATNSFVVPMSSNQIMVVHDTPDKRRSSEPDVAVTVEVPEAMTPQEVNEAVNAVRNIMVVEKMGIQTQGMEILFERHGDPKSVPVLARATRTGERYRVQIPESELYGAVDELKSAGARILSVSQIKPTLEEFFMNLVEADRAQANAIDVSGK